VHEAVNAILQVLDGLDAAHSNGVLHRDVKPANCFVDRDGRSRSATSGCLFLRTRAPSRWLRRRARCSPRHRSLRPSKTPPGGNPHFDASRHRYPPQARVPASPRARVTGTFRGLLTPISAVRHVALAVGRVEMPIFWHPRSRSAWTMARDGNRDRKIGLQLAGGSLRDEAQS
jgi:serine/threonine protein kinase